MSTNRIDPGELRNVVVRLRQLLSAYDNASFVVRSDLSPLDDHAEALASSLRPQLRDTANGISDLLARLEDTPGYTRLKKEILDG